MQRNWSVQEELKQSLGRTGPEIIGCVNSLLKDLLNIRQLGWWRHLQTMNSAVLVKRISGGKSGREQTERKSETVAWDTVLRKFCGKGKTWTEAKKLTLIKK